MIVVNFKTYSEVTSGTKALELAALCERIGDEHQVPIILCVQATDIYKVSREVTLPVFAQHIDALEPGKHTGYITPFAVKENGAQGVMINHSEHRIGMDNIKETIQIAKQYGLSTLVCVESAEEAKAVDQFAPDMIALEEPSLIGTGNSIVDNVVGKQKVEECIKLGLTTMILVGAGVMDQHDIRESLRLGSAGVLLASGITLAQDPKAVLTDLCKGFK